MPRGPSQRQADAERLLDLLLKHTHTQTALLDRDFNFIRVNEAYARAGDRPVEEFVGKNHFDLYPSDARLIFEDVVRTKRAFQTFARPFEYADHPEWGTTYWDWTLVPVLDSQGEVEMLVLALNDVSERERARQEMQVNRERTLRAGKLEALGRLAAGVAHDFNNVLAAVIAGADGLRRASDNPTVLEQLEDIVQVASRGRALTRQLLTLGGGAPNGERMPTGVDGVLKDMWRMLRRLVPNEIELTLDLGCGGDVVQAQPGQLEQIVLNLVLNAADAIDGAGCIDIATSSKQLDVPAQHTRGQLPAGRYCELRVSDTGSGIDSALAARIMEPFFTTKPAGRGTGLGLSIVQDVLAEIGGGVQIESEPGEGCTFRVYLPNEPAPAKLAADDEAESALPLPGGSERVLLVEDDPVMRRALARSLHRLGYDVLVARDGREALDLAAKNDGKIDLLLTDLMMPAMNGRELSIRMAHQWPAMKMLFISGNPQGTLGWVDEPESDVFTLPKPFTTADLAQRVRETLDAGAGRSASTRGD